MATETIRKKTKICTLDLDTQCIEYLKTRFDVYMGSLGTCINVANINRNGLHLLLNYDFPSNFQEYEIFVQDMISHKIEEYDVARHTRNNVMDNSLWYFVSNYPQTIFNPIPFSSHILKDNLKKQRTKPAIIIAFQAPLVQITYLVKDIARYNEYDDYTCNNYEHLGLFNPSNLTGSEVKLCDNIFSKALFEPFLNDIEYNQIYKTPTIWKGDKEVKDERFIPLLLSKDGSVVSYIWYSETDIVIVLPHTKCKVDLLEKVFQEVIETVFSDYLPEIKNSSWLKKQQYLLPNESELLAEKEKITTKYKEDIALVEQKIEDNNSHYDFLHKLITATGDELVQATIKFFKWLGFEKVIDKDKNLDKDFNEEDIQIDTPDKGLLVVEIKGINGTSTDAQCSQILKVVNRRREEQQSFNIYGLYIVNNERGIEPLLRTIPPFNSQQIKDATYDKRGLCYTWQLYNLFFEIEDGIITREEAQTSLLKKGLIDFKPSLIEVGVPRKYYRSHTIVCINISDIEIKRGGSFYYSENDRWKKVKIVSIQDGDKSFDSVSNGSYGFGLDHKVPNKRILYVKANNP